MFVITRNCTQNEIILAKKFNTLIELGKGQHIDFGKLKQAKKTPSFKTQGRVLTSTNSIKISTHIYKELFADKSQSSKLIYDYLAKNNFPKLSEQRRELTNASLTMMELTYAIPKQKEGNIPSVDGIPAVFYKKRDDILVNKLKYLFFYILEDGQIPESQKLPTTTLISKEGKDKEDIANYRPIALLNVDYKIFLLLSLKDFDLFSFHYPL